ncbi:MAG: hypothetical protein R3Y56_10555 [Akkermansia sp.]
MSRTPKKKGTNVSQYTIKEAAEICVHIANGGTALTCGRKWETLMRWRAAHPDFDKEYEKALDMRVNREVEALELELEKLDALAMSPSCTNVQISAIKIKIDAIKWKMSKLLPKYSDKQQVELSGEVATFTPARDLTDEVLQGELARKIAEAQAQLLD